MDLTKSILSLLAENGCLDRDSLCSEIIDSRTIDRASFLCQKGYLETVGDQFSITNRGKEMLKKMP
ncbi:hypothetical protein [Ammoniphilus sp. 3BR4]|uniref:hypothetical protein n=1 Tax=Ammoniphilus sp. 3BR4 TaxID=3158265 RepID=UPI0034652DA8